MDTIKHIVNNFLCAMFGHKKPYAVTAYGISVYPMSVEVEIYEVSICQRCGVSLPIALTGTKNTTGILHVSPRQKKKNSGNKAQ